VSLSNQGCPKMSRPHESFSSRFVGSSGGIDFPESVQRVPKCLQPGFQPTKGVADEFSEHGCPLTRFLDDDRFTALAKYTEQDAYEDINAKMISDSHEEWENTIFYLNEGIKAMPKPRGRHPILWRGISDRVNLREGQVIVFKNFSSCTKSRDTAERFAQDSGTVFEIHTWSLGADIQSLSQFPEEEEILLAPYSWFKVTRICGREVVLDASDAVCVSDVASGSESSSESSSPEFRMCPNGHELESYVYRSDRHRCDVCRARFSSGERGLRCKSCDYDLCSRCGGDDDDDDDDYDDDVTVTGVEVYDSPGQYGTNTVSNDMILIGVPAEIRSTLGVSGKWSDPRSVATVSHGCKHIHVRVVQTDKRLTSTGETPADNTASHCWMTPAVREKLGLSGDVAPHRTHYRAFRKKFSPVTIMARKE